MFRKVVVLCVCCWCADPFAYGKPDQVIVMRHGEKPDQGDDLSLKGNERAAWLVPFFKDGDNGTPVAVYAGSKREPHFPPRCRDRHSAGPRAEARSKDVPSQPVRRDGAGDSLEAGI